MKTASRAPLAPPARRNDQHATDAPLPPRWWAALALITALTGAAQVYWLAASWTGNPFARVPLADAQTYWSLAGRIAGGQLVDERPFFAAPLHPYILAPLRAVGGGLLAAYALQAVAQLATVVLVGWLGARRFSPAVGLLGATLFALLWEPAYYTGRVLYCSLQLLLVVLVWLAMVRLAARATPLRAGVLGAVAGVNTLANPPAVLLLPLLALWSAWQAGSMRERCTRALLVGVAGAASVFPAALHNFAACGEWIPLTAHAGLSFAFGNSPIAEGVYTPIPGISTDHAKQNDDAWRLYAEQTGGSPTWRAVNAYFFERGLKFWRDSPGAALALAARKLYWFATARHYADIYAPTLEAEADLPPTRWPTPLPTPWIVLPGLVAAIALLPWLRSRAPEVLLAMLPLVVVGAVHYSPRYRLPAAPLLAVLTAWLACEAWRRRRDLRVAPPIAAVLLAALATGPFNRAIGFDRPESFNAGFRLSLAAVQYRLGDVDAALANLAVAATARPDDLRPLNERIAILQAHPDRGDPLPDVLKRAALHPDVLAAQHAAAVMLDQRGRSADALEIFARAATLAPHDAAMQANLGMSLLRNGRVDEAQAAFEGARGLDPSHATASLGLSRTARAAGRHLESLRWANEALALAPENPTMHVALAEALWANGRRDEALDVLARADQQFPQDRIIAAAVDRLLAEQQAPP